MRIFEEFERLQRQSTRGDEGLGLGLAIVQRYADLLGHPLHLHSTQGVGTLFSVTLTYGQVQAQGQGPKEETGGRDLDGLRVLCLDDGDTGLRALLLALTQG